MSQGPSSGTQAPRDERARPAQPAQPAQPTREPRAPSPEPKHDDLDDRTEVWNLTAARIRIPNGQVIRPHASAKVAAWGVWRNEDVVKAWVETGALTETDPGAAPEAPEAQGGKRSVLSGTALAVGPVQSVFTGRVEGLQEPRLVPAGGEKPLSGQSGSGKPAPAATEAPKTPPATNQQSV